MKILKDHTLIKTGRGLGEIRSCRVIAESLDKAEENLEIAKDNFLEAEAVIKKLTSLDLFPKYDEGLRYFFWESKTSISQLFETRAAAIRALIDDEIEWD